MPAYLQNDLPMKYYGDIVWLLAGIFVGSLLGLILKEQVLVLKPIGDIFLNLLFTAVVPLVFFAISSAIAESGSRPGLIGITFAVFLSTVLVATGITIVATWIIPVTQSIKTVAVAVEPAESAGEQLVKLLTVEEFYTLLSRKNMLALIIFSALTGIASRQAGAFRDFLHSGNEVMKRLLSLIMKLSPLGLGAYFAYQVAVTGPQLFGDYAQALAVGHAISFFYYLFIFSLYAFLAGGVKAIGRYWKNNLLPSVTALGTCSSVATIPANLRAAEKMGIPGPLADLVIPLGASLHKEGSAIAAVIKIAVAFALAGRVLNGVDTLLLALLIAVLVSVIEGGIPNGGYVGQLLIVSAYHLPSEVLPAIMVVGTLLDPVATLLNATGDTVGAMLIRRFAVKD
jgi:Na+/H+-dicarboxylate symporter